jgi:hypothetical protein
MSSKPFTVKKSLREGVHYSRCNFYCPNESIELPLELTQKPFKLP